MNAAHDGGRRRLAAAVLVVLAAGGILGGCGAASSGGGRPSLSTAAPPPSPGQGPATRRLASRLCQLRHELPPFTEGARDSFAQPAAAAQANAVRRVTVLSQMLGKLTSIPAAAKYLVSKIGLEQRISLDRAAGDGPNFAAGVLQHRANDKRRADAARAVAAAGLDPGCLA